MQLKQLELFAEVVQLGSFSAVAERHLINPTSISRSIQTLESQLGFKLLKRSTRQLNLTEAGETYYQHILPILDELKEAHQKALDTKDTLQGALRVTLPVGFTEAKLLDCFIEFRKQHPELVLELLITDECLDLDQEKIDVAVRIGQIKQPNWVAKPLIDFTFVLCASPEFLRNKAIDSPAAIKEVETICLISHPQAKNWCFQGQNSNPAAVENIWIHPSILATNEQAAKQFCLSGLGIALLPNWLVDNEIESGKLVEILPEYRVFYKGEETSTWIVYPNREYIPAKTRALINSLTNELSSVENKK